jgi:hypothetical protein
MPKGASLTKIIGTRKIYHITHIDNLESIIDSGGLLCDAAMIKVGGPTASIGMSSIKSRRLGLPIKCYPGDVVGDYVPFYFCPRSIMLFLIHRANHAELAYRGGQGPILHLEADLTAAIEWAEQVGRRWAFSLSNAGAAYTEFRHRAHQLIEVNWDAVDAIDFRDAQVKEGKQAEFLMQGSFPWQLVQRIGVQSSTIHSRVVRLVANAPTRPVVEVKPRWYF